MLSGTNKMNTHTYYIYNVEECLAHGAMKVFTHVCVCEFCKKNFVKYKKKQNRFLCGLEDSMPVKKISS